MHEGDAKGRVDDGGAPLEAVLTTAEKLAAGSGEIAIEVRRKRERRGGLGDEMWRERGTSNSYL